ncbi:cytochrome P450 [Panus rudis PR-1116 ss-1]|nr:cytochrome P450 [Panus rudis PR-1116 ss-1]
MASLQALCAFVVCGALYVVYRRIIRPSLNDVPGPQAESFWLGNLRQLFQGDVGVLDWQLLEQFGGIARIKGAFGEDRLWVADPKALQYILQTSGYNFPKMPERRALSRMTSDQGLVWADGDDHKRQRKAMLPAFGQNEAKALIPIFSRYADAIVTRWKDLLSDSPKESSEFNIPFWLSNATLDAIGEAAFDYSFGVMDNANHELAQTYRTLMTEGMPPPSSGKILFQELTRFIPPRITYFIYDLLPAPAFKVLRHNRDVAHKIARELIGKAGDINDRRGSRDIMSILVRANMSQSRANRLTDEELVSQMRTIMLAGHETTSNTLTWALYELARHPDVQSKLREEIRRTQAIVRHRGEAQVTATDMDNMPYLLAFLKEVLRFHPVAFHTHRRAAKDDVIPLSKPVTLESGKVVSELLVPQGTRIVISITAYNRNKDVWGEDAHVFNPDRWLNEKKAQGTSVGVVGNLLSFLGGVRACIGWRFALYEMQAFLIELVNNFEFTPTPELDRLRRVPCLVMAPIIDDDIKGGMRLPLKVTLASRD